MTRTSSPYFSRRWASTGATRAQNGHWKSLHTTIVTSASSGPLWWPGKPRVARARRVGRGVGGRLAARDQRVVAPRAARPGRRARELLLDHVDEHRQRL